MPFQTHRVFCATPGDLEEERRAFQDVAGRLNEEEGMPRGLLFAPVTIVPSVLDKRAFQGAVNENIRSCSFFVQVLEDTWGPPEKNFERDYALALRCAADPALPMREVAVLCKRPLLPHRVEPEVAELKRRLDSPDFVSIAEFEQRLRDLLSRWFAALSPAAEGA
jgi:hypothetical protein